MDIISDLRKKYRIFDISVIDYIKAYVFIGLVLLITKRKPEAKYFLGILPISVIAHTLFDQETTVIKRLKSKELNITKIVLVILSLILLLY